MSQRPRALLVGVIAILLADCSTPPTPPGLGRAEHVAFTLAHNFDDGELDGWASYPPAQDTAYDTTLFARPQESAADKPGFALERTVRASNDTNGIEVGVIRRVHGIIGSVSGLVTVHADRAPDAAYAIACGKGGGQRRVPIHDLVPGKRISFLASFDGPAGEVEAVIILASWSKGEKGKEHRLLLDNLEIRGKRPQRLVFDAPRSQYLDSFNETLILDHPRPGEPFKIEVHGEQSAMRTISCAIDGKNAIPLVERGICDGKRMRLFWEGDICIDTPGLHRLILLGKLPSGETIATSARVLVVPALPGHPRLYGNDDRIASLKKEAERNEELSRILNGARASARLALEKYRIEDIKVVEHLPTDLLIEPPPSKKSFWEWYGTLAAFRSLAGQGAFLYAVDGDAEAGRIAKEAMLRMCAIRERWLHPWFPAHGMQTYYMMGEVMAEMGFAYDLLHPLLSGEERKLVRRTVIEYGLRPAFHEMVVRNRIPFHGSNWIAVNLSGQLIAAAAIFGEEKENPGLEPYLTGMLMKMEAHIDSAFLADGSYGEGVSYQGFAMEYHGRVFPAMERLWSVNFSRKPQYARSYLYHLYTMTAGGGLLDFGDSSYYLSPVYRDGYRWMAGEHRDPLAHWLYRRLLDKALKNEGDEGLRYDYLLWKEMGAEQSRESLPPSRLFEQKGTAVLRAGWGKDDACVVFQCGPAYNHNHIDTGTFHLRALGEDFITEAGKAHYYDDPNYQSYYIQPAGHNTILVDGDPESMFIPDFGPPVAALRRIPRIVNHRFGKVVDWVSADLTPVYKVRMKEVRRKVTLFKPDALALVDRVETVAGDHTYTWLFHTPGDGGFVKRADDRFTVIRPGGTMSVRVVCDRPFASEIVAAPQPLDKDRMPNSTLRLTTKASASAVMVVLFQWHPPGGRIPEAVIRDDGKGGITIGIDGREFPQAKEGE